MNADEELKPEFETQKPSMLELLKRRLVHHEAKAGRIRKAIAMLEADPELEQTYELFRDAKG